LSHGRDEKLLKGGYFERRGDPLRFDLKCQVPVEDPWVFSEIMAFLDGLSGVDGNDI
jgi:hypothetical protein